MGGPSLPNSILKNLSQKKGTSHPQAHEEKAQQ